MCRFDSHAFFVRKKLFSTLFKWYFEGLLFFVLYRKTYRSAGVPRRCNVSSRLVNFVDRPDSLILDDYHADLSVHDGHSELC